MTTDHYLNLEQRAKRLTFLIEHGAGGLSEEIACRSIRLAFGMEHGIEGFSVPTDSFQSEALDITYVNRGDPYEETLVRTADGWRVSCWADELEKAEHDYGESTGESKCGYCGEWSDYVDPDNDGKGLCCDSIDPDSIDFDDIVEGAARALFVAAYADAADEAKVDGADFDGRTRLRAGEDWFDVAPCTPPAATASAHLLLARTAGLAVFGGEAEPNDSTASILQGLCKDWMQCGVPEGTAFWSKEEQFGHYLAMQALGHGVGLSDDMPMDAIYAAPTLPYWDGHYDGSEYFNTCGNVRFAARGEK